MILYYGGEDDRDGNHEYIVEGMRWVEDLSAIGENDDVLVLFSEPTDEDLERIQKMDMNQIIAHEGVHLNCRKFRSKEKLFRLIADVQNEQKEKRLLHYLEHLKDIDSGEREYLDRVYRIKVPGASVETNLKPRDYSGKLITYRGCNALFKVLVKTIARQNMASQILLIDGDLLRPSFDEIFGIRHISTKEQGYATGRDNTGINIALELLKRKVSVDEILKKTLITPGIFVLKRMIDKVLRRNRIEMMLGNYNIYNYENYSISSLQTLVSAMLQRFDFVIVKLSDVLHDEFSMSMTHRGDLNLMVVQNARSEIRYYAQVYEVFASRQDIDRDRLCILKGYSKPDGILSYLFKHSYKGSIKNIASILRRL